MLRPCRAWAPVRWGAVLLTPSRPSCSLNLVFAVWHAPPLYQLALVNPVAHAAEHSGLLLLALLTWWPVFGPPGVPPPAPRGAGAYPLPVPPPTVLGAIIALAEVPIYPFYWQAPGLRALPQADQQLG